MRDDNTVATGQFDKLFGLIRVVSDLGEGALIPVGDRLGKLAFDRQVLGGPGPAVSPGPVSMRMALGGALRCARIPFSRTIRLADNPNLDDRKGRGRPRPWLSLHQPTLSRSPLRP